MGKAEFMEKGANPRYVLTSLAPERIDARSLYEDFYCARGDMENRIKEQQLDCSPTGPAPPRPTSLYYPLDAARLLALDPLNGISCPVIRSFYVPVLALRVIDHIRREVEWTLKLHV